jgi:hypothetical protein
MSCINIFHLSLSRLNHIVNLLLCISLAIKAIVSAKKTIDLAVARTSIPLASHTCITLIPSRINKTYTRWLYTSCACIESNWKKCICMLELKRRNCMCMLKLRGLLSRLSEKLNSLLQFFLFLLKSINKLLKCSL